MNSYWHFYNYWSLLLFMKIIVKAHLPQKPPGQADVFQWWRGWAVGVEGVAENNLQNSGPHFSAVLPSNSIFFRSRPPQVNPEKRLNHVSSFFFKPIKPVFHAEHLQIGPPVQTHCETLEATKIETPFFTRGPMVMQSLARALHVSTSYQTHCWNNWTSSALTHVTESLASQRLSRGLRLQEKIYLDTSAKTYLEEPAMVFSCRQLKAFKCSSLRQTVARSHSLLIVSTMDSSTQWREGGGKTRKASGLLWNSSPKGKPFFFPIAIWLEPRFYIEGRAERFWPASSPLKRKYALI